MKYSEFEQEDLPSRLLRRMPFCGDGIYAPKFMYTVFAMAQSAAFNFIPIFYEHTVHFSKLQIGVLQTLPSVCSLIAPPFWGVISDYLQNQRYIHIFCIIAGAFLLYVLQYVTTFQSMIPAVIIATFFTGPQASLLDHAVLDMISKVGGEYGKQRLFGAVGYGLGAYLTGILVAVAGISWAFNISLVISLFSVFVLRFIPVIYHYAHDKKESSLEKSGSKQKPSLMNGLKFVSKQSDVLVLLIVVFTLGLMLGVLSSFLTLNMYNLSGGNANIIGVAIMCETSSELPAFFFSHKIIQKLGTVNVLLLSILAYALRISYYWYMTNPWSAIPFEFLHGVSFGLAWAAVTQYIYSSAPVGFEGTMMGILNAVQNGLGKGFGSMIGGYLYHTYGPKTMWLVSDLGAPLALIGVGLFTYFKTQDEEVDDEEVLENSQLMSPVAIDLKSPIFLPGGHRTQTISYESLA